MSTDDNIVKITREVAEHYISLMLKTEIVLTIEKWNNLVEIMEDGCREVLNDVSHDILSEMQKDKFDFTRN